MSSPRDRPGYQQQLPDWRQLDRGRQDAHRRQHGKRVSLLCARPHPLAPPTRAGQAQRLGRPLGGAPRRTTDSSKLRSNRQSSGRASEAASAGAASLNGFCRAASCSRSRASSCRAMCSAAPPCARARAPCSSGAPLRARATADISGPGRLPTLATSGIAVLDQAHKPPALDRAKAGCRQAAPHSAHGRRLQRREAEPQGWLPRRRV
jgi:hypothetical protein